MLSAYDFSLRRRSINVATDVGFRGVGTEMAGVYA